MILFIVFNIIILLSLSLLFGNLSIFAIGLIGLITVSFLNKKLYIVKYHHLSFIFFISISLMLIIYYGYMSKYGVPYYIGGSDDLSFEKHAFHFINQGYRWPKELFTEPFFYYYPAKGFVWFLACMIRFSDFFGGYHTVTFRVFNVYILLLLGMLVYDYFKNNYSFKANQNLIILYAITLFPNVQFISLHVFRDTINAFVLFSIFYIWDKHLKKHNYKLKFSLSIILLTIVLTWFSFWIREQNIIFIALTILVIVFLKDKELKIKNFGAIFGLFLVSLFLLNYFDVIGSVNRFNEYYSNYLDRTVEGLSASVFSIALFPYGIIVRAVYALVSPFPGDILRYKQMFSDIDTFFKVIVSIGVIAQIYLLPYLFMNIRKIDKMVVLFSIYFMGSILLTFTFRHFIMIYPFMIILMFRKFYKTTKNTKLFLFLQESVILVLLAGIYP